MSSQRVERYCRDEKRVLATLVINRLLQALETSGLYERYSRTHPAAWKAGW